MRRDKGCSYALWGLWLLMAVLVLLWGVSSMANALEPELEALRKPASGPLPDDAPGTAVRDLAMREAALGSAVQAGTKWRYQRIISDVVLPNEALLDEMFDFEPLVGREGSLVVVPPVVTSSGEALSVHSDVSASSQGKSYRLVRGGRMVSVIPHWRHYLMELPDGPKGLHHALLPKSGPELGRWRGWVDQGWERGIKRADELFEENVARLARDYAGMMLFRRLAAESLASGPITAETLNSLEISDDEIVFERRHYRLTETGRFIDLGLEGAGERGSGNGSKRKIKDSKK